MSPVPVVGGLIVIAGLYACGLYSFLLFHSLVELFSITVAFIIFILAWHTRTIQDNRYLLFIGIASLSSGSLELFHTLSYKGMGIFAGHSSDLPTQLWIASRYVFSLSFFLAPLFIRRNFSGGKFLAGYGVLTSALLFAIFSGRFPACFVEGSGLTSFKIISEYVISTLFLASFGLILWKREFFDRRVLYLLSGSLLASILSELAFTEYASVYGPANMIGHFFLLASVFFIYRAIVTTGIEEPSALLFRNLKLKEEALRISEAKYRSLFDNMIDGFAVHRIITDENGKPVDYVFLEVNSAFERLTGLKGSEILGKSVREVLPGIEKDPADWIGVYGAVALSGNEIRFEQYSTSIKKWYSVASYCPMKGYFVAIFEDITERKLAEEALRHSLDRFALLANSSGELLQTTEPQNAVESICRNAMDYLDCDVFFNYLVDEKTERLHLNAWAGIPEDEAKRIEWLDYGVAVCGCVARDGRRIVAEHIPSIPDERTELVKQYGIMAYACHPLLGPGGKVIGTLSFGACGRETFSVDDLSMMKAITDHVAVAMSRMRGEESVRRAKEEWERTFNAVPDLIAIMDNQHRIMRANRAMIERLNLTEDCMNQACYLCVHGTDSPISICPHTLTMSDGGIHEAEIYEERLGGDFLVTTVPLSDARGELIGSVHVARDITARKNWERQLQEAYKELESFSYSVSHDLRAPLRHISGFLNLIVKRLGEGRIDEKTGEYIRLVSDAAKKMGMLIDDLLEFSRMGRSEMRLQRVNFTKVLDEIVNDIRKETEGREIIWKICELPDVYGDPSMLRLVLMNLLSNAVKFSSHRMPAEIEVGCKNGKNECVFFVKDNGAGFDMKYADKLFGVFSRLHSETDFEGTGIGLASVKRIIKRHGGNAWAEGEVDKGAIFYFSLPVKGAD